tara:strand:- start:67 stop:666 length:600 start_codon:yes stop_codon:yes gene_type:complete
VFDHINDLEASVIGEIGGGISRLLPALGKSNKIYNIEKFEGDGNGPVGRADQKDVQVLDCFIGESDGVIPDGFFDCLFSVSVIEHIPTPQLRGFVEDHLRIMKPGATAFHAIDLYIESGMDVNHNEPSQLRFSEYIQLFVKNDAITLLEDPTDLELRFGSDFATNPDQTMYVWNKSVPQLSEKRLLAQSVSLIVGFSKN